jgi:hypothetical protein
MIDNSELDLDGSPKNDAKSYKVYIPHTKKVLVMPILEEILGRVEFYIEEKDRNYHEAKRQAERLK